MRTSLYTGPKGVHNKAVHCTSLNEGIGKDMRLTKLVDSESLEITGSQPFNSSTCTSLTFCSPGTIKSLTPKPIRPLVVLLSLVLPLWLPPPLPPSLSLLAAPRRPRAVPVLPLSPVSFSTHLSSLVPSKKSNKFDF